MQRVILYGAVLVVVGAIIGVAFIALQKSGTTVVENNSELVVESYIASEIASLDSDGDGLKDWEESLWGTDPNNRDSDGDETPDGEEVDTGRDPTVPAPGDERSEVEKLAKETYREELSDTDRFAQDFFERYLELKERNALGGAEEDALVAEFIKKSEEGLVIDVYSSSDLNVVSKTPEVVTEYSSKVLSVFESFSVIPENELVILSNALESGEEEDFAKLDDVISIYKTATQNLANISIPNDAISVHVSLLNGFNSMTELLTYMRGVNTDPIKAIASVNSFTIVENDIRKSIENFSIYIK